MRTAWIGIAVAAGCIILTMGLRGSLSGVFDAPCITAGQERTSAVQPLHGGGKSDTTRVNALLRQAEDEMKRDLRTAYTLATEALELADRLSFQRGMARAHAAAGWALLPQGDAAKVRDHFELALKFAEERKDGVTIVSALRGLGMLDIPTAERKRGAERLRQSAATARGMGDACGEAYAQRELARYSIGYDTSDDLIAFADTALAVFAQAGDAYGMTQALICRAEAHMGLAAWQVAGGDFTRAAEIADSVGDRRTRLLVRIFEGELAGGAGKRGEALTTFQEVQSAAEACGDLALVAHALRNIAINQQNRGMPRKAREYFEQLRTLYRRLGNDAGELLILTKIGVSFGQEGRPATATEYFRAALDLARSLKDTVNESASLINLGINYQRRMLFDSARTYLQEALTLARMGIGIGAFDVLWRLGLGEARVSDHAKALEYFMAAEKLVRDEAHAFQHAVVLNDIAGVHNTMGNWSAARTYYTEALAVFERMQIPGNANAVRNNLALVIYNQGSESQDSLLLREALGIFQRVHTVSKSMDDPVAVAIAEHNIGICLNELGRYEEALAFLRHSLSMYLQQGLSDDPNAARACATLGRSLYHLYGLGRARDTLRLAVDWGRKLKDDVGLQSHFTNMSRVFAAGGDYPVALDYHKRAMVLRDSLLSEETRNTVAELSAKYEAEQREKEIALQKESLALKDLALTKQAEELARQDLRGRERAQRIVLLEKNRKIRRLQLTRTAAELEQKRSEALGRRQQSELLAGRNRLQASLLARENTNRNAMLGSLAVLLIIAGILIRRARERRRAGERMNQTLAELRRTQDQLIHAEKMATLGEMTAGIAHEIRNPMNFISNFAQSAQELAEEARDAQARKEDLRSILDELDAATGKIAEHSKRAEGIVAGMLMHARSQPGVRELSDVNHIAEEYAQLAWQGYRAQHPGTAITFTVERDPAAGSVEMVAQEMARVVLNVVQNALQAVESRTREAPEGYAPAVHVRTHRRADGVEIRISDNGAGIPEELRKKIFQPFFTTKTTGEGTGLGLSMAYDIVVKGHGGSIDYESAPGEGATFVIFLPR